MLYFNTLPFLPVDNDYTTLTRLNRVQNIYYVISGGSKEVYLNHVIHNGINVIKLDFVLLITVEKNHLYIFILLILSIVYYQQPMNSLF